MWFLMYLLQMTKSVSRAIMFWVWTYFTQFWAGKKNGKAAYQHFISWDLRSWKHWLCYQSFEWNAVLGFDFMEANKVPLEKTGLVHSFQGSQKSYQINKEGQSLAGTGYFEDLEEKVLQI